MLTHSVLEPLIGIGHAFFTRAGGVSGGIYASLNCGFGADDEAANVAANRSRAMARLGLPGDALVTAYQVHGCSVRVVDGTARTGARTGEERVDGMVTRETGIALGILTADCAPVLFGDARAGIIGAAHAGWRGALAGILEATVAAMETLGAERADMRAAIGPCIAQASYQVGPEFPAPFLSDDADNASFFVPSERARHFRFDLAGYVAARLKALGLAEIGAVAADTCTDADRFFSYRRATLRGEPDYGRALSAIALAPDRG